MTGYSKKKNGKKKTAYHKKIERNNSALPVSESQTNYSFKKVFKRYLFKRKLDNT